jgi:hypothetical protein
MENAMKTFPYEMGCYTTLQPLWNDYNAYKTIKAIQAYTSIYQHHLSNKEYCLILELCSFHDLTIHDAVDIRSSN